MFLTYRVPWHLRPVAVIALIWGLAGVGDYLLRQFGLAAYPVGVAAAWAQVADAFPRWVNGAWAVGVWGGLIGAILLAFREAWAPLILAIAFLGFLVAIVWVSVTGLAPLDGSALRVMLVTALVGFLLWLYARWMHRREVLA